MAKPSLRELEGLVADLVLPFYQVERDVALPAKLRRPENDAEHCWSVAFLACSLAPQLDKSLDTGKIAQLAIVHDLLEVFSGDTSPWHDEKTRQSKEEREQKALKHIAAKYAHFPWIVQTIQEYESRSSKEAKFVWAVDKIIILLVRYIDRGQAYIDKGVTKQLFDARLTEHRKKAHAHPAIGEYYEELLELFESHPEYFYTANKN